MISSICVFFKNITCFDHCCLSNLRLNYCVAVTNQLGVLLFIRYGEERDPQRISEPFAYITV